MATGLVNKQCFAKISFLPLLYCEFPVLLQHCDIRIFESSINHFIKQLTCCNHYKHDTCHHILYSNDIMYDAGTVCSDNPPNTAHFMLYCCYTIAAHGHLGRGNRIKIPYETKNSSKSSFPIQMVNTWVTHLDRHKIVARNNTY